MNSPQTPPRVPDRALPSLMAAGSCLGAAGFRVPTFERGGRAARREESVRGLAALNATWPLDDSIMRSDVRVPTSGIAVIGGGGVAAGVAHRGKSPWLIRF